MRQYLSFLIGADLLKRIDDFRFQKHFGSRALAIRWLLEWALEKFNETS